MASQYAPELRILRPANVPLIRIDGLAEFRLDGGWEFSSYFTRDPVDRDVANISLDLLVRPSVRIAVRRRIDDANPDWLYGQQAAH